MGVMRGGRNSISTLPENSSFYPVPHFQCLILVPARRAVVVMHLLGAVIRAFQPAGMAQTAALGENVFRGLCFGFYSA